MWLQVERRFADSSIVSYRSRLKCFIRDVGDIQIDEFTMADIFKLKKFYLGSFMFQFLGRILREIADRWTNRWSLERLFY